MIETLFASTPEIPNVVTLILTSVISSVVIAALITGIFNYLTSRGNTKIAARKDVREGESEEVGRYRQMADQSNLLAEQARKSAETAVSIIQQSLEATQSLVINLQQTVTSQNETIRQMSQVTNVQAEALARMTADRDRTAAALEAATNLLHEQESRRNQLEDERQSIVNLRRSSGAVETN